MKATTKRSGAELRQAAAVREAIRRESSFLGNLAGAQDDYEWIVEREAWTDLGHETFADWWQARVQPTMRGLSMRPTRALADKVIEKVRADEAGLPPAQRRTQEELAELAGVSRNALANRDGSRSSPRVKTHRDDLEESAPAFDSGEHQDPQQAEAPPADDLDGHELPAKQEPAAPFVLPDPDNLPEDVDPAAAEKYREASARLEDANYLAAFAKAMARADDFLRFEAERIAPHAEQVESVRALLASTQSFYDRMVRARSGLRLVNGGRS